VVLKRHCYFLYHLLIFVAFFLFMLDTIFLSLMHSSPFDNFRCFLYSATTASKKYSSSFLFLLLIFFPCYWPQPVPCIILIFVLMFFHSQLDCNSKQIFRWHVILIEYSRKISCAAGSDSLFSYKFVAKRFFTRYFFKYEQL